MEDYGCGSYDLSPKGLFRNIKEWITNSGLFKIITEIVLNKFRYLSTHGRLNEYILNLMLLFSVIFIDVHLQELESRPLLGMARFHLLLYQILVISYCQH
jgi:hypothetical protein